MNSTWTCGGLITISEEYRTSVANRSTLFLNFGLGQEVHSLLI